MQNSSRSVRIFSDKFNPKMMTLYCSSNYTLSRLADKTVEELIVRLRIKAAESKYEEIGT